MLTAQALGSRVVDRAATIGHVESGPGLPVAHHRIRTSLGTIAVAEIGRQGPPLVMLHGGGPGASGWSSYAQNLPELARHFRVLLPDLPGFGDSYRPTAADLQTRSLTEVAADALSQVLRHLGIAGYDLVGDSLGGAAAVQLAVTEPGQVRRLVLIAPDGGWRAGRSASTEGHRAVAAYYQAGPSPQGMRRFIRAMVADLRRLDPLIVLNRYEASIEPTHAGFYRHYLNTSPRRGDMDPPWRALERVQAPTCWSGGATTAPTRSMEHT